MAKEKKLVKRIKEHICLLFSLDFNYTFFLSIIQSYAYSLFMNNACKLKSQNKQKKYNIFNNTTLHRRRNTKLYLSRNETQI